MGVELEVHEQLEVFPLIEVLETVIVDHETGERRRGTVGNNFSSYVRDYDFSILRPRLLEADPDAVLPESFGELHGNLFQSFLYSDVYAEHFDTMPLICLSVSSQRTYTRTSNEHPILGVEYLHDQSSLTDEYFLKMGMRVRYFMPPRSVAPLAFYYYGDLPGDYTNLELISTISTMETFQKIYRPEIYNANSAAPDVYRPSLTNPNYSTTQIAYDREEHSRLATSQGQFAEEVFIQPHHDALNEWSDQYSASARTR